MAKSKKKKDYVIKARCPHCEKIINFPGYYCPHCGGDTKDFTFISTKCPSCGKRVPPEEVYGICPHCGEDLVKAAKKAKKKFDKICPWCGNLSPDFSAYCRKCGGSRWEHLRKMAAEFKRRKALDFSEETPGERFAREFAQKQIEQKESKERLGQIARATVFLLNKFLGG